MAKKYENLADYKLLTGLIAEKRNDEVKSLLTRDVALAHFEGLGSLLHYAIMCDNEVVARELIDLGSDVNRFGLDDKTPLGLALSIPKGAKFADMLLDANADINITDNKKTSALTLIFAPTYFEYVRKIGVILRRIRADFSSVEEFLDHLSSNNSGFSVYHAACLRDVNVLECLLNRGFNVDHQGPEVRTALFAAIELEDAALVRWLINHGANINATDARGNTALINCAHWARKNMLELLLELGANPNIPCRHSALLTAFLRMSEARQPEARQSYAECIETLLFYDSRIPQNDGVLSYNSYFGLALQCDNQSLVNYLVAHIAMTDKLGISDHESTLRCHGRQYTMKLYQLESYYESCRKLLELSVCGELSLFELLTGSDAKMRIHARSETLCQEIDQICAGLSESCPYYAKRMSKRISKAVDRLKLEEAAIEVLHELFGSNYNQCPDFGRRVVAYLSDYDLEQLRQV